jgi:hypothetical protein
VEVGWLIDILMRVWGPLYCFQKQMFYEGPSNLGCVEYKLILNACFQFYWFAFFIVIILHLVAG